MSGVTQSLRSCLRSCRSSRILQIQTVAARHPLVARRTISSTPARWKKEEDDSEAQERRKSEKPSPFDKWVEEYEEYETLYPGGPTDEQIREQTRKDILAGALDLSEEERAQSLKFLDDLQSGSEGNEGRAAEVAGTEEKLMKSLMEEYAKLRKPVMTKRGTFWNEDERDQDLITDEANEDDFEEDDITSMAHGKLDEIRERRQYARVTVWEMPLLAKFAKPFEPPAKDMPLRFRYTTYMGEFHPAEKKVVLEFCPSDLDLTEAQQLKLKKLAGPRYNPEREMVRISCEMFEHQAQNKRYLGDLVEKLVAEAKDPTDTFEDVPLDTRHHEFKAKPKFPKEWRMTEERRKAIQATRAEAYLLDKSKQEQGALVDGREKIKAALGPSPSQLSGKLAELVAAAPIISGVSHRGYGKARRGR